MIPGEKAGLKIKPVGQRREVEVYSEMFAYRDVALSLAENERVVGVEGVGSGTRLVWIERTKR